MDEVLEGYLILQGDGAWVPSSCELDTFHRYHFLEDTGL